MIGLSAQAPAQTVFNNDTTLTTDGQSLGPVDIYRTLTVSSGVSITANNTHVYGSLVLPTGSAYNASDSALSINGSPALVVLSGGTLLSATSYLGYAVSGQRGEATVSAGTWTNSGGFFVGGSGGTGSLTLTGGTVTASLVELGSGDGTGTGTLVLNGGVLATNGIDRYTTSSTVSFDGGTLRATSASASLLNGFTAGSALINSGGLTLDDNGYAIATAAQFTGTGGLTKTGSGTLSLAGASTYTGNTTVNAGTLLVASGGSLTGPAATIALGTGSNGALALTGGAVTANRLTLGLTGGTGSLSLSAGTLTVSTIERWSGGSTATFNGGVLRAAADAPALLNGFTVGSAILDTGGLTLDTNGFAVGFSPNTVLSGAGGLTKTGNGTLSLAAAHAYTGNTTISQGTLALATGGSVPDASTVSVASGATYALGGISDTINGLAGAGNITLGSAALTVGSANASSTWSGTISGTGSLSKAGSGTLALSGNNTYTGGTTVTAGTLTVSAGGVIQHPAAPVVVASTGTGSLNLTGGSIAASNVVLGHDGGSATLALNGGVLTTSEIARWSVASTATFNGGTLRAAADTSALLNGFTAGSAVLQAGGLTLDTNGYAVSTPAELTGTGGLTKIGTGSLTLTGASSYSGPTEIQSGALVLGTGSALSQSTSYLKVQNAAGASFTGNGGALSAGTLYVGFNAGQSGSATLNSGTWNIGSSVEIGSSATSSGSLTLTGGVLTAPQVVLGRNNGTGQVALNGGVLATANLSRTGSASSLSANGGTLRASADTANILTGFTAGSAVLQAGGLTLDTNGYAVSTSAELTGSGGLTKTGTTTLTLTGASTYAGNTTISAGTLQLGNGGATGSLASGSIVDNGVFAINRSADLALSSVISGPGSVTQSGTGALILTGANTYSGVTTVSSGTLQLGNGGSTGSLASPSVVNNGTLAVNRSDALTLSAAISGAGRVTKSGDGTLNLTGANTYSGGTVVYAGTLAVAADSALGTSAGALTLSGGDFAPTASFTVNRPVTLTAAGGAFAVNSGLTLSLGGVASGAADLTKTGAGTLVLSAANTYTGSTDIQAGTLVLDTGGALAQPGSYVKVQNPSGASFTGNGGSLVADTLYVGFSAGQYGSATLNSGAWTLGSSVELGYFTDASGALTITGGTLTVPQVFLGRYEGSGQVALNGGVLATTSVVRNPVSAGSTFSANGGTLRAMGDNTFFIDGFAGSSFALGTGGLTLDSNGFNIGSASILSGAGGLTKTGAGTLTLSGANTYSGATSVNAGTLALGASDVLPDSTALSLASGTTFTLADFSETIGSLAGAGNVALGSGLLTVGANNASSTYSGLFSGSGSLTKIGSGTLTLFRAQTYTGALAVDGGSLNFGAAQTLGSVSLYSGNLDLGGFTHTATNLNVAGGTISNGTLNLTGDLAISATTTIHAGQTIATTGTTTVERLYDGATLTLAGNSLSDAEGRVGYTPNSSGTVAVSSGSWSNSGILSLGNEGFGSLSIDNGSVSASALVLGRNAGVGTLALNGGVLTTSTIERWSGPSTVSFDGGTLRASADSANLLNGFTGTSASIDVGGLILDTNGFKVSTSSDLSGVGGLIKSGAGTLTLSGANTYSGPTFVTAGTLALTGSATSSAFTVQAGGTLSGTGALGSLTVNSGGTISPGASPGTLSAGSTVFNGGGTFSFELNNATGIAGTNWDLLSISGTLTIAASAGNPFHLSLTSLLANNSPGNVINFNSAQNSSYTFVTASDGIVGFDASDFAVDASGFTDPTNGGTWTIAQSGNNLDLLFTVSAIPEPDTCAAICGGLALLFGTHHRRRNRAPRRSRPEGVG